MKYKLIVTQVVFTCSLIVTSKWIILISMLLERLPKTLANFLLFRPCPPGLRIKYFGNWALALNPRWAHNFIGIAVYALKVDTDKFFCVPTSPSSLNMGKNKVKNPCFVLFFLLSNLGSNINMLYLLCVSKKFLLNKDHKYTFHFCWKVSEE